MQPRRSWVSRSSSETNAPRRNATPGTSGNSGGARPQSAASMARRASASSAARSAGVSSGSAMVWLSATDRMGAIELLVQNHACHLVRQGELRQAPQPLRLAQDLVRQRIGAADREDHVAPVHVPLFRPLRELDRGPFVAATRQRDEARALGNRSQDPRLILHLMLLDLRVVPQPLQILVTHGAERGVLHAPHRDDAVAHHAYMPRNRCIAATRSTARMSGITKMPLSSRILSAAALVGPLAPSQMILALMWGAFLRVMTFSVAAGINTSQSTVSTCSCVIVSALA